MGSGFFATNREKLIGALKGGLVVIAGWTAMQWHGDTAAPFRQEANFWYLSGIEEPDWMLVVDGGSGESWLVAPEIDEVHRLFDGDIDADSAWKISGVDKVLDWHEGRKLLRNLAQEHDVVYTPEAPPYAKHVNFTLNPAPENLQKELHRLFGTVKDCQKELAKLRAVKLPVEIAAIESAATLSVEAFEALREKFASCQHEYEVEAELAHYFRRHNARHAFEPIVASGKNACTLHYTANSGMIHDGSLLLVDAGARLGSYSADITRTFAFGSQNRRHKAVHQAVQSAERQIIKLIRPGLPLKKYLASTDAIMQEALLSLGLMKDARDKKSFRRYFPHAVSHGLGLDVHESLGGYEAFEPGMVLTVEPGIYLPEESIGVRIEDDILVTENGCKNLTAGLSTDY